MRQDYTQAYINRGDILIKMNRFEIVVAGNSSVEFLYCMGSFTSSALLALFWKPSLNDHVEEAREQSSFAQMIVLNQLDMETPLTVLARRTEKILNTAPRIPAVSVAFFPSVS
ncbi:unnamed protein product [Notodromas monacha]|uniref:Uncharacterized protein n=1 Tax=Notodromas monacha TaxID=399045 RepID=A0A7R9BPF4_9CRUS|nr:unnamed protein product [Notodromas monacha]CAG0917868.1 unnamed protein product [Notodromas monacha]